MKKDWGLFLEFSMAAAQMEPNNKKKRILSMEVEPVTIIDPKIWKWEYQRLYAALGKRPTILVVTRRSGTSQVDQFFWGDLTKFMGGSMGKMLQAQQIQQQPAATPLHKRAQVILQRLGTEITDGICSGLHRSWHPKNLGEFQIFKECADNRQELLSGMMYCAKTNGIKIDTSVLFIKLEIEEMVKTKFNPGGPVAMYETQRVGFHHWWSSQEWHNKLKKILGGKRQKLSHKRKEPKRSHSRWKKQIQGAHQEIGMS